MTSKIISPIAIDLGAKYTGVVLPQYEAGEDVTQTSPSGLLVVNTDRMTWSQQPRRQKRHQVRGYKRRKLAKKLLWIILENEYGVSRGKLSAKAVSYMNGLLNRRGFTYLYEEMDESALQVPPAAMEKVTNGLFNDKEPLSEQVAAILADPASARSILEDDRFPSTKTACKQSVPEQFIDDKAQIAEAWEQIRTACEQVDKSQNDGHKPRKDYLENIQKDIRANEVFNEVIPNALSPDEFSRLVGHISNLQLRVLRKYFNDKGMAGTGYWDPERLHKFFFRWVKSWHAKRGTAEKKNQQELLSQRDKPVIEIFTRVDPRATIPPYEDQNNRRPPRCLSVHMDPARLEVQFHGWADIAKKLAERPENRFLLENLDKDIEKHLAVFMQRLIERSVALDPYQLRLLVSISEPSQRQEKAGHEALRKVLGGSADTFVDFCDRFYRETAEARSGLWFDDETRLLSVCNRVPRQKKNMKPLLLEAVLGIELSDEAVETLEKDFWRAPASKTGGRSLRGWARLASEKQKEYGVHMKEAGEQQLGRLEAGAKPEDKDLAKLYKFSGQAAVLLARWYGLSDDQSHRFSSPHSLAQLFNIIEGDVNGFNRTCTRCTSENAWRMKEEAVEDHVPEALRNELPAHLRKQDCVARATRLSSDSTRPFDGQLAAIIEATAREIAKRKIEQLLDSDNKCNFLKRTASCYSSAFS